MRIFLALLIVLAVFFGRKLQQQHALGWRNPKGTVYVSPHGALAAAAECDPLED